jgi:hypothetical protein
MAHLRRMTIDDPAYRRAEQALLGLLSVLSHLNLRVERLEQTRAGLAASSADSDGAVFTYATHILQHHWHLCRPQAALFPFARSHRNVRTRCTHEEWRYCGLIPEEIREVMHCRRKSWFQLTTDVTQTRECVSVEYGVLAYCTHAIHEGGRKASTGTPLQAPAVWGSDAEGWSYVISVGSADARGVGPTE